MHLNLGRDWMEHLTLREMRAVGDRHHEELCIYDVMQASFPAVMAGKPRSDFFILEHPAKSHSEAPRGRDISWEEIKSQGPFARAFAERDAAKANG